MERPLTATSSSRWVRGGERASHGSGCVRRRIDQLGERGLLNALKLSRCVHATRRAMSCHQPPAAAPLAPAASRPKQRRVGGCPGSGALEGARGAEIPARPPPPVRSPNAPDI